MTATEHRGDGAAPAPTAAAAALSADDEVRMTLAEHFRELRKRLALAGAVIVIGLIAAFFFYEPIFSVLKRPYCSLSPAQRHSLTTGCTLIFTHPLDGFSIRLKVAAIAGVLVTAPLWLYQLWAFITPGLRRNERKWALVFVGASTALFAGGVLVAYFMLSTALEFLLNAVGNGVKSALDISQYLGFVSKVLVVFGLSFEFPLVIVLLNVAGIVSAKKLQHWRRMEIFLVTVFAAVVTPSQDPFTMLGLAAPLWALYEVAVLIARYHDRRKRQREAASPWANLSPDELSPLPPGYEQYDAVTAASAVGAVDAAPGASASVGAPEGSEEPPPAG